MNERNLTNDNALTHKKALRELIHTKKNTF